MLSNDWQIIVVLLSTLTLSSHCNPSEIGSISALCAKINRRSNMEDFAVRIENEAGTGLYAVLDGHEGYYSAHYGKKYLTETFPNVIKSKQYATGPNGELDSERMLTDFTDQIEAHLAIAYDQNVHDSGTTCLMVVAEKNKLTVGNVGDSRGVMCNSEGKAIELSVDHKAGHNENEEKRMIAVDERLRSREDERIHDLAISRSLGDFDVKEKAGKDVIISKPEIKTFDLTEHKPKFMILASDGLWDKVDSETAVDFIKGRYLTEEDFGATSLANMAIRLRSRDNITVMIVVFKNGTYDVATTSWTEKFGLEKSISKILSALTEAIRLYNNLRNVEKIN